MVKASLRQWCLLTCLVIVGGFFSAVPSSMSAQRQPALRVGLQDTGKTVALSVGQQMIVTLPLQRAWGDNSWYVASNSGGGLKLIAGPDTRRPPNWTHYDRASQVFYFQREAPGTANLVLERTYTSKPMILKVVDR